jgi:hypothetical protein
VNEATDELPGVSLDDLLLPVFEGDGAVVLLAGAMLWEKAWPVLARARYSDAALLLDAADAVVRV